MDKNERIQLDKMLRANNTEDCTNEIREKKHSKLLKNDVKKMIELKEKYKRLKYSNKNQYETMLKSQCSFIYEKYTDIFNRINKDEIDFDILWRFLDVLEKIETGELDQHEGSYAVGSLLKQIYIDSSIKKGEKIDKKYTKKKKTKVDKTKNISWNEYKNLNKN
jgi:hypothetical protein|tara:strand:- start:158 stop:649 length:492 start_codon:yes stop_codon:yes gene_type:complete